MNKKDIKDIVIRLLISITILGIMILTAMFIKDEKEAQTIKIVELKSEPIPQTVEIIEEDPYEIAVLSMQKEMDEIAKIEEKQLWFFKYKKIVDKYSHIIDPPETIYDYFTEEEIYLIQRTVETECYDADFVSKCNVASIVLNRFYSDKYGSTIEEVITTPNQFAYGRKEISADTILAVEYSFAIEDTTNGCVGFRCDEKPETWNGWIYSYTDDAGHHLYKEKEGE